MLSNIDRQLVAAVQINAGARCHESANLLQCYQLYARVYQNAINGKDEEEAQWAREALQDSEVKLRKFLFQCSHPGERLATSVARDRCNIPEAVNPSFPHF